MSDLLTRYLEAPIRADLARKMVFLGGSRQVGKTTLAQSLIAGYHDGHPEDSRGEKGAETLPVGLEPGGAP